LWRTALGKEMTTLLQEFEEWAKKDIKENPDDPVEVTLAKGQGKMDELKIKYKVGQTTAST
jgi:hypothetical protein